MPHTGIDPVPIACQMVQSFQTIISRNKKPVDASVISVTMIHAGEATNVVPDSCELQGTVRTFTLEVLDLIEQRMRQIAQHIIFRQVEVHFPVPPNGESFYFFRSNRIFFLPEFQCSDVFVVKKIGLKGKFTINWV